MENRKLFKKRIQEFSKEFANKYGFKLYKCTGLIRNKNNLLQIISFQFPPHVMKCNMAILPLYLPNQTALGFNFGNQVNHFKIVESGLWGLDESKMEEDINRISYLLEKNVIPWFEKISSPVSFVRFAGKEKELLCPPFLKDFYLAFSYLYIKDYNSAKKYLTKSIKFYSDSKYDYEIKKLQSMTYLVELIDKELYDDIEKELNKFIENTKIECKIDKII